MSYPPSLSCNPLQHQSITASVLSPKTWPFELRWLPRPTYLVGGNVRDALLGRHAEYLDLDFVMPEKAVETARAIANHYRAGYVLLDAERQIARVVFDWATVDFAQQVGSSLEDDLGRRDFTVNAIAYDPVQEALIDPLGGNADLGHRCIRMISPDNLKEDPLRLLRAYRQSAQLGFDLDPETQSTIRSLAPLIAKIPAERVQAELNYLLSTPRGTEFLKAAWDDGLLQSWLPHATEAGLATICRMDDLAIALEASCPGWRAELSGWLRDQQRTSGATRSWLKVAKLACLVAPQAEQAERELWELKYSRAEVQSVLTAMRFAPWLQAQAATLPPREQYLFFQAVGAVFPAVTMLAVASGASTEAVIPLLQRFLTPDDPIAHPTPLLTGTDLMKALHLPPGPKIGQLLHAIQMARAEGKVASREEAIQFAAILCASPL